MSSRAGQGPASYICSMSDCAGNCVIASLWENTAGYVIRTLNTRWRKILCCMRRPGYAATSLAIGGRGNWGRRGERSANPNNFGAMAYGAVASQLWAPMARLLPDLFTYNVTLNYGLLAATKVNCSMLFIMHKSVWSNKFLINLILLLLLLPNFVPFSSWYEYSSNSLCLSA